MSEDITNTLEKEDSSLLNMEDSEFESMDWETTTEEEDNDSFEDSEEENEQDVDDTSEDSEDTDVEEEENTDTDESEEDLDKEEESEEEDDTSKDDDEEESSNKAQAELDKLFAPFTANGQEMKVESVEEAIRLMQMGVGFQAKMAGLKPNLKLMRMLDNNDLLDESKLSFLIDLHKKEPDAISKLIKDSGINPLDVDVDKADEYKPNTYTVDDKELAISEVIENIRGTNNSDRTLDVISNKWDESSKQVIVENPQVIQVIHDHINNGIYDKINSEITRRKALGQLTGYSDIQAYKYVGDILHAEGKLGDAPTKENPAPETVVEKPSASKNSNSKLKSRKRATGAPKATKRVKPKQDFNPLELSDEEFEKLGL
jgi:hypothetical protein